MSSVEKPAGLSSLVSGKTGRTTRALQSRFIELVEKVRQTRPASDIDLLRRSFEFAAEQHRAQLRISGDPYLSHPLEVAHILADMKLDIKREQSVSGNALGDGWGIACADTRAKPCFPDPVPLW